MQIKPQMVEAVMFYSERGICKEMLFPEFEALLDGVVNMPVFADQQMRGVFLMINPRLLVKAAVFFYLDFDEKGFPDSGWNLPLRHLADRAGRGPDLGAGPIRLACRSQCPVSWHQMHLWDPSLAPGNNDLVLLRDAVKRNGLGLLIEDDSAQALAPERLQLASEDAWRAPDPARDTAEQASKALDQEHRVKTAQVIKQQRLRIASLTQQGEEELAKLKLASAEHSASLQAQIHSLKHGLQQQEALSTVLKEQLTAQAEGFQSVREDMTQQMRALEHHGRSQTDILRSQFEGEAQAKLVTAVREYKEQIAIRDMELAYRDQQNMQLRQEFEQFKQTSSEASGKDDGQILERLAKLGMVFVVYHPGAGHLTIALQDIARYQDNPTAYAAAKCFVAETQYRQWLAHYQQATCEALSPNGERCAMPLERVDTPSRFVNGDSNCCTRHKTLAQPRTSA